MRRQVTVIVKVAELNDGKAVKSLGKPRQRNLKANDLRVVWLEDRSLGEDRGASQSGCKLKKSSPC